MSFQVYSDLHLEHYRGKIPEIEPKADYLILAGDIATPSTMKILEKFLKYCSTKWQKVFYICGNHEFYGGEDIIKLKEDYRTLCSNFSNVHFLDNEYIIVDGIAIYGFIGWTPLDKFIIRDGYDVLCDFDNIKIEKKYMTPKMMVDMSKSDLELFKTFIDKVNNEEIICDSVLIISHFPPIRDGTSAPEYTGNELQAYFSWENMMKICGISCKKIKTHVSGHTHWSYDFMIEGIRYISNQMGYPKERVKFNDGCFNQYIV
uniref:Calcineurin-like phosphoesterase domain-containing protein n=1 Tax=viral metagenome TaxID=1070528 RepID=A0A6C0AE87_9ZZZZ